MWTKIVCAVCGHSAVTENLLLRAPHCAKCGGPVRLHTASEADIATAQGKTVSGITVGKPISVDPQRGFTVAGMTVKPRDAAYADPKSAYELARQATELMCRAAELDSLEAARAVRDAMNEKLGDIDLIADARAACAERDPTDLPMDVRSVVEASGGPEPTHYGASEPERDPEMPPGMP